MRLSAKAHYACIAALELARHFESGELLQVRRIADVHDIPPRFLVQILLQLKSAGVVTSTRGAAGGYRLSQSPAEITLAAILEVIEGPSGDSGTPRDGSPLATSLSNVMQQVTRAEEQILTGTTLADLIQQVEVREPMYYI